MANHTEIPSFGVPNDVRSIGLAIEKQDVVTGARCRSWDRRTACHRQWPDLDRPVTLRFDLQPGRRLTLPRVEQRDAIVWIGRVHKEVGLLPRLIETGNTEVA